MQKRYLIGVDLGTSGTKAALYQIDGKLISDASVEVPLFYPKPGVVDRLPGPLPYDEKRALEIIGSYETNVKTLVIRKNEAGLVLEVGIKPEIGQREDIARAGYARHPA